MMPLDCTHRQVYHVAPQSSIWFWTRRYICTNIFSRLSPSLT